MTRQRASGPACRRCCRRYHATAVGVNGLLYVVGGFNGVHALVATEVYNPATRTWRAVSDMPTPRWSLGAGAINGKLYAIGGQLAQETLQSTQVYTP